MNVTQPGSSSSAIQSVVEACLQAYARFGVDLGLTRVEKLLADLGNPHRAVPTIHVAGTNGKGSVCAYLSAVLTAAGYRTGRYTSPHLVDWTERICIDQVPISWLDLWESLEHVEQAIDAESPTPTQFEVLTAAAWQYFAAQRVDVAVVEVGLGGRLDATNVCDQPLATVIVSIGRDHWQRLGDTLAAIAYEKAGIIKPTVPIIAGPLPSEAQAVVTARATEVQAPLTWVSPAEVIDVSPTGATLQAGGIQYPQTLLGDHQRVNSACAIAALQVLRAQGWHISPAAIARGMAQVRWPGRLQQSQWQGQPLLIDGAHNVDAARSLRAYVDKTYPGRAVTWLMGMLQTKDHPGVFAALLSSGDRLHLVPVPGHLSAEPAELAAIAHQTCSAILTHVHPDLATGLAAAIQTSPVVLCGSLYLIGHFYDCYGA